MTTSPDDRREHPDARELRATYRVQARGDVGLGEARELLPYLERLGVSHVYLSPVLQAREGSSHGYDVTDADRVDEVLGGDTALLGLTTEAHERGLGVVVDIVPNHMAADPDRNAWWRDVLRNGRASAFAGTFDITWDPPDRKLSNQVLLPILGDHYGRVLDRGELTLERNGAEVQLRYHERTLPLEPRSLSALVGRAADASGSPELALAARTLAQVASPADTANGDADDGRFAARREDVALVQRVLHDAVTDHAVRRALDAEVARINEDREALHHILEQQNYRLARWQTGSQEIDYRRFFDINDLVGVRIEDPVVFAATHARIRAWVDDGLVDGLRVDHPDGLADPARYCADLRALAGERWIVVEKILEHGEELPPWPVDGTTGYEFAAAVNRLFVAPDGYAELREATADLVGVGADLATVVREAKLDALRNELAAELRRLTDRLVAVCERHPRYRDFSRRELQEALATGIACLPVYRTYITADGSSSPQDRRIVEDMVTEAAKERPDLDAELFTLLQRALLGAEDFRDRATAELRQRFQQLSGAVMAKGKEDTALYRYPVLLSVNEVGADPGHPAATGAEVHAFLKELSRRRPAGMLTLSTHDTKRSEDVRARLDVLSEIPSTYLARLQDFLGHLGPHGEVDPLLGVVLFQTLVGAHPLGVERATQYVEKAMREAGRHTSWLEPDADYEATMRDVVRTAVTDERARAEIGSLVDGILVDGRVTSLAQRLLLLTAPGVPDLYQGSELWDLSLVDPDNRRPVDFAGRATALQAGGWSGLDTPVPGWDLLDDPGEPGLAKLALTARALAVRRARPRSFGPAGTYEPVHAAGAAHEHVFAFLRGDDVLVAVPRLGHTRRARHGGWADTELTLPPGPWADALTPGRRLEGTVRATDLFGPVPVALLWRDGATP